MSPANRNVDPAAFNGTNMTQATGLSTEGSENRQGAPNAHARAGSAPMTALSASTDWTRNYNGAPGVGAPLDSSAGFSSSGVFGDVALINPYHCTRPARSGHVTK